MALALVSKTDNNRASSGSATHSATLNSVQAGNLLLIGLRWFGAQTISTLTCSGETVVPVGSPTTGGPQAGCLQWAYIAQAASTGNKTVDLTLTGNVNDCGICLVQISGHDTADPIGGAASDTDTTTNPSVTLSAQAANSAIFGMIIPDISGVTPGSGYTTLDFTNWYSYWFGQYTTTLDAGTSGDKAVAWVSTSTPWAIDAIEIKMAGSASIVPHAMAGYAQQ